MALRRTKRTITVTKMVQEAKFEPYTLTVSDTYHIPEDMHEDDARDDLHDMYLDLNDELDELIEIRLEKRK